jgi:hypothetical protein
MRAAGPKMNPFWWTPERIAHVERTDADTYRTDCLADFRKGKLSLFDYHDLDALTDEHPAEWSACSDYVAALAPGTVGNRWTLVIERATPGYIDREGVEHPSRFAVAFAKTWSAVDGIELRPRQMLSAVAAELARFRLDTVVCGEEVPDEVIELGFAAGVTLCKDPLSPAELLEHLEDVRALVESHRYRIPVNAELRRDLLTVKKPVNDKGEPSIKMPETQDGRRCDYIPLLARCRKFSAVTVLERTLEEDDMAKAIRRVDEANANGRIQGSLHKLAW